MITVYFSTQISDEGITNEFIKQLGSPMQLKEGTANLPWSSEQKWFEGFIIDGKKFYLKENNQVNGSYLVYKVSDQIGFGVITLTPLKKNDIVFYYYGELLPFEEQCKREEKRKQKTAFCLDQQKRLSYLCDDFGAIAGVVNHAPGNLTEYVIDHSKIDKEKIANANLFMKIMQVTLTSSGGKQLQQRVCCLRAKQDIKRGEPLFFDYTMNYFDVFGIIPKLFYTNGRLVPDEFYQIEYTMLHFYERSDKEGNLRSNCLNLNWCTKDFMDWKIGKMLLRYLSCESIVWQSFLDSKYICFYSQKLGLKKLSIDKIQANMAEPKIAYDIVLGNCKYELPSKTEKIATLPIPSTLLDEENNKLVTTMKHDGKKLFESAQTLIVESHPEEAKESFLKSGKYFYNAARKCSNNLSKACLFRNSGCSYFYANNFKLARNAYYQSFTYDDSKEDAFEWYIKAYQKEVQIEQKPEDISVNKEFKFNN